MKNKKNLICLLGGLVLWLSGFWLVRRSGISWETLRALPYLMIGIGCGLFGYGVGEMVNRRVLDSNPPWPRSRRSRRRTSATSRWPTGQRQKPTT